jgi:hypothetical protein
MAHGDKCVILSLLVMQLWLWIWSWFFENINGGGKMNKVHSKTIFTQNGLSIKKLWRETCCFAKNGQLLSLSSIRKKEFSSPICAVNFCKTFCTCFPSSLRQDLIVKIAILFYFFIFGLRELKMAVLRCSLKKRPLTFRG